MVVLARLEGVEEGVVLGDAGSFGSVSVALRFREVWMVGVAGDEGVFEERRVLRRAPAGEEPWYMKALRLRWASKLGVDLRGLVSALLLLLAIVKLLGELVMVIFQGAGLESLLKWKDRSVLIPGSWSCSEQEDRSV